MRQRALTQEEIARAVKAVEQHYPGLYRLAVTIDAGSASQQIFPILARLIEVFIIRHGSGDPKRMSTIADGVLGHLRDVTIDAIAKATSGDDCMCAICCAYRKVESQ